MQVIREDDRSLDFEGVPFLDGLKSLAQRLDHRLLGKDPPALEGDHGEEKRPSWGDYAAVSHGRM
jgi:hypothetical protein